jgi:hypothetical protein
MTTERKAYKDMTPEERADSRAEKRAKMAKIAADLRNEGFRVPRTLTRTELAAALGWPLWRVDKLLGPARAMQRAERKKKPHNGPPYTGPRFLRLGSTHYRFPEDGVIEWLREQTNQQGSPHLVKVECTPSGNHD